MNSVIREIIVMFLIIVATNILLEIGEAEKSYLTRPIRFWGGSVIISIVGGYFINKVNKYAKRMYNQKQN